MRYIEFKNYICDFPIFSTSQLGILAKNKQLLRNQLTRWQKQGLILKLKKGLYILNKNDRKINPSRVFIANQLYSPSYISTEYALSFYELIPERVEDITSITTKKTISFKNDLGFFRYQHINIGCFVGFIQLKDENNLPFFIAEPEKAIVDFLYLNLKALKLDTSDIFKTSYRFQNIEGLNPKKIISWARLFKNSRLEAVAGEFCAFIREEKT